MIAHVNVVQVRETKTGGHRTNGEQLILGLVAKVRREPQAVEDTASEHGVLKPAEQPIADLTANRVRIGDDSQSSAHVVLEAHERTGPAPLIERVRVDHALGVEIDQFAGRVDPVDVRLLLQRRHTRRQMVRQPDVVAVVERDVLPRAASRPVFLAP